MFFVLLVLSALTLLFFILPPVASASDTSIVLTDGPSSAVPGTNISFTYSITNTASASTRYNISHDFEFAWDGVMESLLHEGDDFPFNVTEHGIMTSVPLPPTQTIVLVLRVHVPALTEDQEFNQEMGLEAETRATVALFVTPLGGDAEMEHHFMEIKIREIHDVFIDADLLAATVGTIGTPAERTAVFYLSVSHLSNIEDTDTIVFSVIEGREEGWNVQFSNDVLCCMGKFSQRDVALSITAPIGFVVDGERPYWYVTIAGESQTSLTNATLTFNITLQKEGGVNLFTAEERHRVVTPGVATIFNVTLQNVGNYEDRFSLSFQSQNYSYWIRLESNETETLTVLENTSVHLEVFVPESHPPLRGSRDSIQLSAVSLLSEGRASDMLLLTFEVGEKVNINITPERPEYQENIGTTITIPVYLRNTGNSEDDFSFHTLENVSYRGENLPLSVREKRFFPWKHSLSPSTVSLKPDESAVITLDVTIPLKGFYTENNIITIVATHGDSGDDIPFSTSAPVNVSIARTANFALSITDPSVSGIPGETLKHTLEFTSKCNFPLRLQGSSSGRGGGGDVNVGSTRADEETLAGSLEFISLRGWEIHLEFPDTITLDPFEFVLLHFKSTVEVGVVKDTTDNITVSLNFTSPELSFSKSTSLVVVVKQFFKLSITSENTEHKIVPGGTTNFELTVHNEGNGVDIVFLNVTEVPDQFNPVSKSAQLSIGPFSSRNYVLTLSMTPLSKDSPGWNSKHRVKLAAHSQLSNATRSEFLTPWMSVSLLGVFEPEPLPELDIETLYKQEHDSGELNDVVTQLDLYLYNERTVAIPLRIYNLGFGDDTTFVVRDMILPPFLTYRLMDANFNYLQGSSLVLDDFQEKKVYLLFSAGDFNISTALINPPVMFRIHILNDDIENPKSVTNSFLIQFHYLKLDIWLARLKIEEDIIEGRTVTASTIIYLSEGEIGSGMIGSGMDRVDKVTDLKIKVYLDNTLVTTIIIPELTIAEKENELDIRWEIPELEWYAKEKTVTLRAEVASYQTYQGSVDFNPSNNQRQDRFRIQDATVIDITTVSKNITIIIHIVLQGIIIHLHIKARLTLKMPGIKRHYTLLVIWAGMAEVFSVSLLFSFPWNIFFDVSGSTITTALNLIFFIAFPLAAYEFGKIGGKIDRPKRRAMLASFLSIMILPLFMTTVVLGAVFWLGWEDSLHEFYSVLTTGSFQVTGTDYEIYLFQLVPFYIGIALLSCWRTYKAARQIAAVIKRAERDIQNTKKEIKNKVLEMQRELKQRPGLHRGGGGN